MKKYDEFVREWEQPEYTGPKENPSFTNIGADEEGNILGNCRKCGAAGVLIREHKCKATNENKTLITSGEDKQYAKTIKGILNSVLKPGKDKGSSQAMIDVNDFDEVAAQIILYFKPLMK